MWKRLAAVALTLAAGCSDHTSGGRLSSLPQARFKRIDEIRGSYGGVGIGGGVARMQAVFGRGRPPDPNEPVAPLGDRGPFRGPPVLRLNDSHDPKPLPEPTYRYRDVSFFFLGRRIGGFMITGRGALTRRGVGIGTSLAVVRRRYRAHCFTANTGTEYERYRACTAKTAPHRFVWFGGDPVANLTISFRPFEAG